MTLLFKSAPNIDQGDLVADEFKFVADGDAEGTVSGYGAMFGNIDNGRDMVMPGAFADSLKARGGKGVPMLRGHEPNQLIGIWTDAKEDRRGLVVKGALNLETQGGREALALMRQGALDGLSIGFRTMKESYDTEKGGRGYRKIEKADLWEVSLVTFPMNPKATVTAVKTMPTDRELEAMLRDEARLSDRQAKAAVSIFKKTLRDGGEPDKAPRDAASEALSSKLAELAAALRS